MPPIKVYLDTNMVLDVFLSQAKAFREGTPFLEPKKFAFLLAQSARTEFLFSFLTKAEVFRELTAAVGFTYERADRMWNDFLDTFEHTRYVEGFFFDSSLVKVAAGLRIKLRTLLNFLHLFIAMKEDAYFVTGDKNLIEQAREQRIYEKVLSYIEFRKLVESSASSHPDGGQ